MILIRIILSMIINSLLLFFEYFILLLIRFYCINFTLKSRIYFVFFLMLYNIV